MYLLMGKLLTRYQDNRLFAAQKTYKTKQAPAITTFEVHVLKAHSFPK